MTIVLCTDIGDGESGKGCSYEKKLVNITGHRFFITACMYGGDGTVF